MGDAARSAMVRSVLTAINEELRRDWTESEISTGRDILLPWSNRAVIREVINSYLVKGWLMKTSVLFDGAGRFIIINFVNPAWTELVVSMQRDRKNLSSTP